MAFEYSIHKATQEDLERVAELYDAICNHLESTYNLSLIHILRCTRMEDVIFNGTPARKPQGFAEVTLTIDNADRRLDFDSDKVAVTRRCVSETVAGTCYADRDRSKRTEDGAGEYGRQRRTRRAFPLCSGVVSCAHL